MVFELRLIAVPAMVFWLLAWGMAATVFFAAPGRTANRMLALGLVAEGIFSASVTGWLYLTDDPAQVFAFGVVGFMAAFLMLGAYVLFLGVAIETPWVRPLRTRAARFLVVGSVAAGWAAVLARPDFFVGPVFQPAYAPYDFDLGPFSAFMLPISLVVFVYSLGAAASAYRRARSNLVARKRAHAVLLAFGTRDALYVLEGIVFAFLGPLREAPPGAVLFVVLLSSFGLLVSVLLLGYGIMSAHLFDIDLRVRWTVRQGTVAAAFLAIFFIVSQLGEAVAARLVGDDGWILGAIAAGLLLFFLSPLQRLADRLARAAVPKARAVADTPLQDRLAFYEEQVQVAWRDGKLTAKERHLLEVGRERLGLSEADAARIERAVLGPRGGQRGRPTSTEA